MEDETQRALKRLYRGFGQRELIADDARGLRIVDRKLLSTLDVITTGVLPAAIDPIEKPPRTIAIAIALALFSQPHLASTFAGSTLQQALVISNEVLQDVLGLSAWELDDLRDEIDRRAGSVLKQSTLVNWLQSKYPPDETLFQLLFPGTHPDEPELTRHGLHLYATQQGEPLPVSALFLPWVGPQDLSPLHVFRGRYVDSGVKSNLARGIGIANQEIIDLLERTLTLLPTSQLEELLNHDRWRHRGMAAISTLGAPYSKLSWLVKPIDPAGVRVTDWLDEAALTLKEPVIAFDALAQDRLHHIFEALYTDLLARRYASDSLKRRIDEVSLFDISAHLKAVCEPLLAWTKNKGTVTWLVRHLNTTPAIAETLLGDLHAVWQGRLDYWTQPSPETFDHSVLEKWITTLAAFDGSIRAELARPMDPRHNHHDVLFLFAAHYTAEIGVDRGLMTHDRSSAAPGFVIAKWFWPTWTKLLDRLEEEAQTTNPEFMIPEGMF